MPALLRFFNFQKLEEPYDKHTQNDDYRHSLSSILSAHVFEISADSNSQFPGSGFSLVPILFGLLILDMKSSFAILLVRTFLKLILNNQGPSTIIGLPMNIAAMSVFILTVAYFWKNEQTIKII